MESEHIEDDEILYRRILYGFGYEYSSTEGLIVTRAAFLDRAKQPSVDRSIKCNSDPSHTQCEGKNGVVWLLAVAIRLIGLEDQKYTIDVVFRPLDENPAHAQIEANPSITSDKVYKRLRTSLAFLANDNEPRWLIYPEGYR